MNRRSFAKAALLAPVLVGRAEAQNSSERRQGSPIVMIHGAWHGGWCWARLSPLLSAAGHAVSRPTLTGCGERRHLLSRSVTLDTHIQDVVQHIDSEELFGVTLFAHSYGGFVATGVADALGERIRQVVMLDAFVPSNGECVLDYVGPERKAQITAAAEKDQTFNLVPMSVEALGVTDVADAQWMERRLTPHPVATYTQTIKLARGLDAVRQKMYVACDKPKLGIFDTTKARIENDGAWRFVTLHTGHNAMITAAEELARTVLN